MQQRTELKKAGLKVTLPRLKILEILEQSPERPLSAEDIYKQTLNSDEDIGLATYYDKELHNQKTANNDLNKVTELLGRHKTLPLPSIVKITNLENGLSLTIKLQIDTMIMLQLFKFLAKQLNY